MLTSRQNPRIKAWLKLHKRQGREKENAFIVEGLRFVEEAIASNWTVRELIYTADGVSGERGCRLLARAEEAGIPATEVSPGLLREISAAEHPQGFAAVVAGSRLAPELALPRRDRPFMLLVDGVQDPGNLGTMIRTADAFGASGVWLLTGTVDLYNAKTLRATMGSLFHLPVIQDVALETSLQLLHAHGVQIAVSDVDKGLDPAEVLLDGQMALVIGNEGAGVRAELRARAARFLHIPMPGGAESLNAAVAAGILMYEMARRIKFL